MVSIAEDLRCFVIFSTGYQLELLKIGHPEFIGFSFFEGSSLQQLYFNLGQKHASQIRLIAIGMPQISEHRMRFLRS
jgi:hypothetical protein